MCLTLCDPVDCSPQGSSVHGISQTRILEWVSISFPRGSSQPRDWTQVSCITGRFFIDCAASKALIMMLNIKILSCNIFISNKFIKSRRTLYFKHHPKSPCNFWQVIFRLIFCCCFCLCMFTASIKSRKKATQL